MSGNGEPSFALQVPSIALPTGGGAIKGIDEQFTVNAATGTMAMSLALPFTPSRGASTPGLRLGYDSGAGNGVVGLGWSIDLPSIGRRIDRAVPTYTDDDIFNYSAGDDLVLAASWDGARWVDERRTVGPITVERFRPRIEKRHDRIERITDRTDPNVANVWWRVITGDDITTCFGLDAGSRLFDSADPTHVLRWLPTLSFDDLGNCTVYEYRADEGIAAGPPRRSDANRRRGRAKFTNRHLVAVRYGNRVAYAADRNDPYRPVKPAGCFHFHTVFDHGDHDDDPALTPAAGRDWPGRADPFSSYRAGFEVRTQRLLRRVLMFHQLDELDGGVPALVRSLDLTYRADADMALLASITQRGYARRPDGTLSSRSLPPIELDYQPLTWSDEVHIVDARDAAHLPGVGGATQWLDLDGEGLVGALTEVEGAWYYRAGLGGSGANGGLRLEPPRPVEPLPSLRGLANGVATLVDLDADGSKQVVVRSPEVNGYFERDGDGWLPWRPTEQAVRISLSEPHVRMLDLVGDGRTDVLIGGGDELVWYRSLGRRGFAPARRSPRSSDEETSPAMVFADDVQRVFLADMAGDGLIDIVRIRNGETSYWPNLGHGRFGPRVAMDDAPWFATDDEFHPERVRLVDITGNGATDIVYLGRAGCTAYRNLSGNGWARAEPLAGPPMVRGVDASVTDVLGNGTPCLVWLSPLPADAERALRYVDLMGGTKPYLLSAIRNNLGSERSVTYRTSTWFHLLDKTDGRPWATRLPFPVHCVHTATIADRIAGTTEATTYRYHHGTYDAVEREFRGFACVEQTTADARADWARRSDGQLLDATVAQAPVRLVTWFDTGVSADGRLLAARRDEQWDAVLRRAGIDVDAAEAPLAPMTIEPASGIPAVAMTATEGELARQAQRACRGTELRREVFGLDAVADATADELVRERTPYSVATRASVVHVHQPVLGRRHAVVSCDEREVLTDHLERVPGDPRREHVVNVAFDDIGTVLTSATVTYARRFADLTLPTAIRDAQARTTVVGTFVETTSDAVSPVHHRLRRPWRTTVWEITGAGGAAPVLTPANVAAAIDGATEIGPHEWDAPTPPAGTTRRRLLRRTIVDFFAADLRSAGDPAALDPRAIVRERYDLAWRSDLLDAVFGDRVTPAILTEGRYVQRDGDWWVPSGRWVLLADGESAEAAHARFHAHIAHVDGVAARTDLRHAGSSWLLIDQVRDAAGNQTSVEQFDWRAMQPTRVVDVNDNAAECVFDELGWMVASAKLGKAGALADDLAGQDGVTSVAETAAAATLLGASDASSVHAAAAALLGRATVRHVVDAERYRTSGGVLAPVVATIVRERHAQEMADSPVQVSFEYSNGAGAVEMRKVQAEPGSARRVRTIGNGTVVIDEVDTAAAQPAQLRWLGDGREVRNHRGNAVKAYEPFFSVTAQFETARDLVESGVTKVQHFDPVDRVVRVDHPDGTFADVILGAWSTVDRDRNDNVLRSPWHDDRVGRRLDAALVAAGRDPGREAAAAQQAEAYADTPRVRHLDPAGRAVDDVVDAGAP
ncbi:MAG: SpvB/TcaC N-terminal domain-containing protein, partial [Ilumatobacteraceae bacterium]